jgi:hypothetical protein
VVDEIAQGGAVAEQAGKGLDALLKAGQPARPNGAAAR